MALTFEQLIGAGGTLSPRGAEEGEPTPTELKTTPTRPLWGSTPLARLSAPTLGQRLGEMLIKTTRAKYEERWAVVEQEMALAYEDDKERLAALQDRRKELRKALIKMDEELTQVKVAKARAEDEGLSSTARFLLSYDQTERENAARFAGQREERQIRYDEDLDKRYELSGEDARVVSTVAEAVGQVYESAADFTQADQEKLLATYANEFAGLRSRGSEEQRLQAAAELFGRLPSQSGGDKIAVAELLGLRPEQVGEAAVLRDKEAKRVTARGGYGVQPASLVDPEAEARAAANRESATVVNDWARSPEGMAVLAALGDDGTIDNEEAAALAQLRNDIIEEQTFDVATGRPGVRGQATPDQVRRESLADVRRYAVLASTPGVGDLVSTDVRRSLDPRRLETLAELSALGEEEDVLRAGMVAPTYRNIAAGVQRERVEARDVRRAQSALRPEARAAGKEAAAREQNIQEILGEDVPAAVKSARTQARAGVMGKTTGLDPNATPEQRRFAQAMARAVQAGAWQERDVLPKPADAMYKLYEKGLLRDPAEAVKKAIELSPDDPDSVLVPYLQRVNRRLQDRDAQPIEF